MLAIRLRALALATLGLPCVVDCAASSPPPAMPTLDSAYVARRCEAARKLLGADSAPPFALFELARTSEPLSADSGAVLAERPVRVSQVALLVTEGTSSIKGPWRICRDAACTSSQDGEMTLHVTQLPRTPTEAIRFELTIEDGRTPPERRSLSTHDQQPLLQPLPPSLGGGTLVVTPYFLSERNGPGAQALLECQK